MPENVSFSADLQSIVQCHVPHTDEDAILQHVLRESLQEHKEVKSIRDQNLRLIRNQLDQTMNLQEVLADGACLFRAFVRSLAEVTGQRYTCEDARRICVENIRQSPELFSRYSRFSDLDHAERYLNNNMSLSDTYGDELCLHSLASALKVSIRVFTPQYGIQHFNAAEPIAVSIAYNGRDHYDATLRRHIPNGLPAIPSPVVSLTDPP